MNSEQKHTTERNTEVAQRNLRTRTFEAKLRWAVLGKLTQQVEKIRTVFSAKSLLIGRPLNTMTSISTTLEDKLAILSATSTENSLHSQPLTSNRTKGSLIVGITVAHGAAEVWYFFIQNLVEIPRWPQKDKHPRSLV
jgi:hypothetical protein